MKKALYISLFIGVFASMVYAPRVFAYGNVSSSCIVSVLGPDQGDYGGSYYLTWSQNASSTSYFSGLKGVLNVTDVPQSFDLDDSPPDLGLVTFRIYATSTLNYLGEWGTAYYNGTDNCSTFQDSGSFPIGATHIIDVSPKTESPLTVIATGTPTNITGFIYIKPSEYEEGIKFRQEIYIENPVSGGLIAGGAITALDQLNGRISVEYPVTHSGYYDETDGLSTSTAFNQIGKRRMVSSIIKPKFSIFGLSFGTTYLETRTDEFIVGTTTLGDRQAETLDSVIDQMTLATSTDHDLQSCNLLSNFSITNCIVGLIIPSGEDFGALVDVVKNEILTRAPIGYATRLATILSGNATTSLPDITVHLPEGIPLSGTTTIFRVDASIGEAVDILADTKADSGQTIWDVTTPLFKALIYMILLMLIINDVTGIHKKL